MTHPNSRSVGSAWHGLTAAIRNLPQLLFIRFVRGVALILLIGGLLLGAVAVVSLLYSQTLPPPAPPAPEVVLSVERLQSIEQAVAARRQAAQTGLILPVRNYFAQPATNP